MSEEDVQEAFSLEEQEPQIAISLRDRVSDEEVSERMGEMLPEVLAYALSCGAEVAGPPYSRYFEITPDEIDFECGIPVAAPVPVTESYQVSELPGGKAAAALHRGPYDRLILTWQALSRWVSEQGMQQAGPGWEVYVTDPQQEPDPSLWETRVYIPVA